MDIKGCADLFQIFGSLELEYSTHLKTGGHLPVTVEFKQVKAEVVQWPFTLFVLIFLNVHLFCFHIGRQGGTGIFAFLI